MTVSELMKELSKFPDDMTVTISDGFGYKFYDGMYSVELFENCCDIGIGGTEIE